VFQSDEETDEAFYSSGVEDGMEDDDGELEEMEPMEDDRLGREQVIDGMKVVRSHTGDYSGLQQKASKAFSFRRIDRTRWKDIIYKGLSQIKELQNI
jgi:hypothetical protein